MKGNRNSIVHIPRRWSNSSRNVSWRAPLKHAFDPLEISLFLYSIQFDDYRGLQHHNSSHHRTMIWRWSHWHRNHRSAGMSSGKLSLPMFSHFLSLSFELPFLDQLLETAEQSLSSECNLPLWSAFFPDVDAIIRHKQIGTHRNKSSLFCANFDITCWR